MFIGFEQDVSLKAWNTFGIDVNAEYFAAFDDIEGLLEQIQEVRRRQLPLMILGGGSNVLLTKKVEGVVLKNELKGFRKLEEGENHFLIEIAAGENWHESVMKCIRHDYAGLENLALIPGCVGAGPMQNIGAYGVELKDVFEELTAVNVHDGSIKKFSLSECSFGYRESVFKRSEKGNWVITSVCFRLTKRPVFHTDYGAISEELAKMNLDRLTIKDVANAVINIRSSKLPDPRILGNAGSFFKNPTVELSHYRKLKEAYSEMPGYPLDEVSVKIPAGWLIEKCGWKGRRIGACGVHEKQALVIVNHGGAIGAEIFELSQKILDDVLARFGVLLEREVNII
jgi:UDP-N-acetylmuramate dehydrogenase